MCPDDEGPPPIDPEAELSHPDDQAIMKDGNKAFDNYVRLVNATRRSRDMYVHLDNPLTLDLKMKTKYALATVLTSRAWLKVSDIAALLEKQGYKRSRGSIRRGLRRMQVFGLADSRKAQDRYGSKEWSLTQRGVAFANNPPTQVKASTKNPRQHTKIGNFGNNTALGGSALTPVPGGTNMASNPSRPEFNKAVEDTVFEFTAAQKSFSAHEITQELRKKVDSGAVSINDPGQLTIHTKNGVFPNILHDDVKEVVHELFGRQLLVGYDRSNNGTFWTYFPQTSPPPPAPATPTPSSGGSSTPDDSSTSGAGGSYDGNPTL